MIAFMPLYDPLPAIFPGLSDYWLWLVVPLVVAISIVYKGTRIESMRTLAKDAVIMAAQIILVMVVAAVVLGCGYWLYVRYAGPMLYH